MAARRLTAGIVQRTAHKLATTQYAAGIAFRQLHATAASFAVHKVEVPVMGESITEGTVDVILKQPGDAVKQDEVICTIATDKVAVDVRSPVDGVLQSFAAQEDEEVEVGSVLAHIDTDGEASSSADSGEASTPAPAPASAPAPAPAAKESSKPAASAQSSASEGSASNGRRPMIQFRHGKANKSAAATSTSSAKDAGSASEATFGFDAEFPSKADKTYLDLPPMYGRPPISADEADAIDMGGIM